MSRDVQDRAPEQNEEAWVVFRRDVLLLDTCGYLDWSVIESPSVMFDGLRSKLASSLVA